MSRPNSPDSASSSEEMEDDEAVPGAHDSTRDSQNSSDVLPVTDAQQQVVPGTIQSPTIPQKTRRRVTRACDECRRKKIKCDARHPCTHCTVYSYECTYNQPSNRRRNPAPQYVESLEKKLQRAEGLLKNVLPNVDLNDPTLDARLSEQPNALVSSELLEQKDEREQSTIKLAQWRQGPADEGDSMLESMVDSTGTLSLDDDGNYDFTGHSSGRAFLRKMRQQFGDLMGKPDAYSMPYAKSPAHGSSGASSASAQSPVAPKSPNTEALPAKQCAMLLSQAALSDACAVLRFVHQPSYYAMLERIYEIPARELTSDDLKFLPLLYSVIALGTLFATAEQSQLMRNGFQNATEQGTHWYQTSRSMMDVSECRDLISLQTMLCMVLFLQCSARLSTCYSLIGIVLRGSIRMGMHRSLPNTFSPVEQETRKRIFWCVRKLDIYVGALLGLPQMLNEDDIDQEQPLEVDDEHITLDGIIPMPPGKQSLMSAFNHHTQIVAILAKTVRYIYPIKTNNKGKDTYIVNHAKIREIEHDLQTWMENLPEAFRPGQDGPPEFIRIQHLLRMAYAHIEMFLYRPFLHYVSQDAQARPFDKRSYACAAACISVSRNIIHLAGDMQRRGLLTGSYWFYMYTTFFAVISLIFYIVENPKSATSAEILKDAYKGKDTLAGLAATSLAADRCSRNLTDLFEGLREKLEDTKANAATHKKRQIPQQTVSEPVPASAPSAKTQRQPPRALTAPNEKQRKWQRSPQIQNHKTDRRGSQDPSRKNSVDVTPQPVTTPENTTFTPTSHGVPDLTAMMFPSADPFAYPNQPMTTLENHDFRKTGSDMSQPQYWADIPSTSMNPFPVTHSTANHMYNANMPTPGAFSQIHDPSDHQGSYLSPNGPNMLCTTGTQGSLPLHPGAQNWMPSPQPQPQHQLNPPDQDQTQPYLHPHQQTQSQTQQHQGQERNQQPDGQPGTFDRLFGEDWGNWMSQRY